jgi:hypothetical protein
LQFVLQHLQTPAAFIPADLLDRLEPANGAWRLRLYQELLLADLLEMSRLERLAETEQSDTPYLPAEYLADVQAGLFAELREDVVQVDPLRRGLQRSYVAILQGHAESDYAVNLRGAARYALQQMLPELRDATARSANVATGAHLADLVAEIEAILKTQTPGL